MQIDLAEEQANADEVERCGGGVALSQGTTTVEFLFDSNDLPGCKGADSIGQSVNMQIYERPIQSVTPILLLYISVCLQLLCYKFKCSSGYYGCNSQSGKTLGSYHNSVLMYILPFFSAIYYFGLLLTSSIRCLAVCRYEPPIVSLRGKMVSYFRVQIIEVTHLYFSCYEKL